MKPTWDDLEVYARNSAVELLDGDEELFDEVLALFLDMLAPLQEKLHEAVANGDSETVAYVAHSIRGSAATVGAQRVVEICSRLEASAGDDGAECDPLASAIDVELDRFRVATGVE